MLNKDYIKKIKEIIDVLHDIYFIDKIIIDISDTYITKKNDDVTNILLLNKVILNYDKLVLFPQINEDSYVKHNNCIIS